MSKKKSILNFSENANDYWKTFFTTLFIVAMFVVLNIFYMIHNIFKIDAEEQAARTNVDSVFESYLVGIMIDKNLEFAKNYPKNYAVNLRLGILYSYKKDYIAAEKQFKDAIEKSSAFDYAPSYQLAKLYVKIGKLQDAQEVMDKISEKPNKRLIRYKGDIYSLLGDAYYQEGYYALSVMKFEKALSYYQIIEFKDIDMTTDKLVSACVSLADKYVEVGKIEEAIMSLEKAKELQPDKISVNYKLGLLDIDNDPYKAYELLSFVNKKSPQSMNSDVYVDLMNKLADIEDSKGNGTDAELFRKKAVQYRKFVERNLLYDKDIHIDVNKIDIHTDIAAREYIMNIQFTLRNNTDVDMEGLYIKVIFKNGNEVIQKFTQKIYDEKRLFEVGATTPPILISASDSYVKRPKEYREDDFSVEIYAYKYPKYQLKLFETEIKKPPVED